jgi:hypothetical protein
MKFNVTWDEVEVVVTRYDDTVEIADDELAGIEDDERAELILERVRETTQYLSGDVRYSETESSQLVRIENHETTP